MTAYRLNDAPVLDQLNGHWAKIAAFIVWKLAKKDGVTITSKDIEAFAADGVMLFTHGHHDGFTFKVVSPEEAERIAAHHEATQKGRA